MALEMLRLSPEQLLRPKIPLREVHAIDFPAELVTLSRISDTPFLLLRCSFETRRVEVRCFVRTLD